MSASVDPPCGNKCNETAVRAGVSGHNYCSGGFGFVLAQNSIGFAQVIVPAMTAPLDLAGSILRNGV